MATKTSSSFFREPRVAVMLIAGALTVVFLVAIVRELLQGHQVRTQVKRLRDSVATEQQHQEDLQNLLTYLQSPTFQERQARLELGLKKSGERVLVVPPESNTNTDSSNSDTTTSGGSSMQNTPAPTTNPGRWFQYFFHR